MLVKKIKIQRFWNSCFKILSSCLKTEYISLQLDVTWWKIRLTLKCIYLFHLVQTIDKLVGHQDYSFASAWHPNNLVFATGNQDKTCRVWDLRNVSAPIAILKGKLGAVRSIKFSSDGQYMVMAEPADFVHVYSTGKDYEERQEIDFFGEISGVSLSPDDESLYIGIWDRTYASLMQYNRRRSYRYLDSFLWCCGVELYAGRGSCAKDNTHKWRNGPNFTDKNKGFLQWVRFQTPGFSRGQCKVAGLLVWTGGSQSLNKCSPTRVWGEIVKRKEEHDLHWCLWIFQRSCRSPVYKACVLSQLEMRL